MISIILVTYNRAHLIATTLQAIKAQLYKDFECIIVDDGSSDDTAQVVASYTNEDPRFSYHRRGENYSKGLPGSRNFGLDLAQGSYVVFCDDDDVVHCQWLAQIQLGFDQFPEAAFCHFKKAVFKGEFDQALAKEKLPANWDKYKKDILEEMIMGVIPMASCTVAWKRECFDQQRFQGDLKYAEEWELYTRMLSEYTTGAYTENALYFARKQEASNTGQFAKGVPQFLQSKADAISLIVAHLRASDKLSKRLVYFFLKEGVALRKYVTFKQLMQLIKPTLAQRMAYLFFYGKERVRKQLKSLKP